MAFETSDGPIKPIVYLGVIRDERILLVEYTTPPNPEKSGWWVPAPEMSFGDDPTQTAGSIAESLGLENPQLELFDVEGFVIGGAWHLLYHFRSPATGEITPNEKYACAEWFSEEGLPDGTEFAHGRWERRLCRRLIGG